MRLGTHIYFDFNAAVVTNTTTNTIALPSSSPVIGHRSSVLSIFPNPANGYVQILLSENKNGAWLELTDATGRKVLSQLMNGNQTRLNTSALSAGVYLLRVTTTDGMNAVKRVVVE